MSHVTERIRRINPLAISTDRTWKVAAGRSVFGALLLVYAAATLADSHKAHAATDSSLPTIEFVVPAGPTIALQDGQVIDGHIIQLDQTNVVIRAADGRELTVPRSTIDNIRFETVTGKEIAGALVGWKPGVYQLTTAEAAVKIYSTVGAPPVSVPPTAAGDETPKDTAEAAGQGSSQAIAAVTVDETANGIGGAGGPPDADGEQVAVATPRTDLEILVSVENSRENGPPVTFDIKLSKASESSVVLIYATIDGTAINGEDYEANRGVVVIKPGEVSAKIEAAVIDDDVREEQEHLQLFLTVDPNVAIVKNRQIVATIEDDDQE